MLKNRERVTISLPKELKSEIEKIAKEQSRTISNLIEFIIKQHLKNEK